MKPLTKSRFKTALECPNKLFFTSKKEYANNKSEDPFLQALASGGFQVEELARLPPVPKSRENDNSRLCKNIGGD
jgi:hypothetical protein